MNLAVKIESLLFISSRPITAKYLAGVFKISQKEIVKVMDELMEKYNTEESGIHIIKHKGWKEGEFKFQMATNPNNSDIVQDFVKEELSGELTRPSLETLTIIAYRGPVSKTEIEQIRGVNCSLILKNLLIRGLVEEREDKDKMAKYYNITPNFIRHLGINKAGDLPDYEKLNRHSLIEEMLKPE